MIRSALFAASAALGASALAADLPPDTGNEIPKSAQRPVVVQADANAKPAAAPQAILPEGLELITAAASPLVLHPIMGCLDDRGRLFVGDATGVNWNKKQLEANPPNRVLLLEDTNHDGVFDKSTVFADKMTFPQGAAWLKGSLYVCSPPGLWKLTDTDGDGVADQREMIVSGFEYTGNAADVHGPFLHPNGRLYWCHGRKGHKVIGKEGAVVHEGLASGIWSCKPDGSDVQWHSLGCGDNPVEVDFTPQGDVVGVQNLYYSQPRGDTLVHWLYGGIYERADQLKAIEGLTRTMEHMPVMYNFGHVAVSGCCFYRGGSLFPNSKLPFLVTHFNTQRVVRMELTPDGGTFKATENEFIKLNDPDIHFTDVLEDADGSVLVINTGGWFRIGCPSSLMAKPDIAGAVYRVRKAGGKAQPIVKSLAPLSPPTLRQMRGGLASEDPHLCLEACEAIAKSGTKDAAVRAALLKQLAVPMNAALEHAVMFAFIKTGGATPDLAATAKSPMLLRRLLLTMDPAAGDSALAAAIKHLDDSDADLASAALWITTRQPIKADLMAPALESWIKNGPASERRIAALDRVCSAFIADASIQSVIAGMLQSPETGYRKSALRTISGLTTDAASAAWLPPLEEALAKAAPGDLPLLLDAIKKLPKKVRGERFSARLQALADDAKQPLSLRLKALVAMDGGKITPETFKLLLSILTDAASPASARIQAASMLAAAPLDATQLTTLAPALASVGPIELKDLVNVCKKTKDLELVKLLAKDLAKNPSLISQQESVYRTAFSSYPPEVFETILLPAIKTGMESIEAKKRQLAPLADKVLAKGDALAGKAVYESGKGTCIACHQIGDKGRAIGPNLSKIGAIRTERDIVESILFPSNTLARDYEAHVIETADGQSTMGVIKSHTAEGLLVADVAGQEKNISQSAIVSDTQLPISLMPMGLDQTLPEKDLLDLVAYLRSLR